MSHEQARYNLNLLANRYILLRLMEAIFISVGIALLMFGVSGLVIASVTVKITLSILSGCTFIILRSLHINLHRFSKRTVLKFIHLRYPVFQESADLLLCEDTVLTNLQRLQKQKVLEQFDKVYPTIKLPNHILQAVGIFVGCALGYIALSGFSITPENIISPNKPETQQIIKTSEDEKAVFIESLKITIKPPAYTGISSFVAKTFDIRVPEGSQVSWLATFSGRTLNATFIYSGLDSVQMKNTRNFTFGASQIITNSGFYQLQWRDTLGMYQSDYYRIDMQKDQPPKISITNLEQFTELRHTDKLSIDVSSTISDDYGLQDAQIIATVSKGSGESVKFREEKIRFSSPQHISGKQLTATHTLNLVKLGLEPGDELYFYLEANDNKTPVSNRNRTETYFISLQDTASYALVSDEGLGVDLMPEYFRSQRQIIIDTEKLLKQQKERKVTKAQFNFTSNELGYDQKVLRLRYGQFLGEEEDSGIPLGTEPEDVEEHADEEGEEDPLEAFSHKHDTENEHNLVAAKKDDHDHHAEETSEEEENPLKAFMHSHDNTEEATFFIQSIKTKLRAALNVMWDAELHLRLYDPSKSLPYQYKALNLLKEISNDSRIYVHRMGFDPPPLKEEKRLTADLSEVRTSTNKYQVEPEQALPGIKAALTTIDKLLLHEEPLITASHKQVFTKAGEELAVLAIENPGASLKALSQIRKLVDEKVERGKLKVALTALQKELWQILPQQPTQVTKQTGTAHELDRKFLHQLEELKHE